LSGGQSAGGVGGLLFVQQTIGNKAYAMGYDGNGNVTRLYDMAGSGSIAASYEYGPFGEVVRASGPLATQNPFQFSTKYTDAETGLNYYGYRYYNASTGRWISRDPISEKGGRNLYAAARNDLIMRLDRLGLSEILDYDITQVDAGVQIVAKAVNTANAYQEAGRSLGAASITIAKNSIGNGTYAGGTYLFPSDFDSKLAALTANESTVISAADIAGASVSALVSAYGYYQFVKNEGENFKNLQDALQWFKNKPSLMTCNGVGVAAYTYVNSAASAIPGPGSAIAAYFMEKKWICDCAKHNWP